MILREMEAFTGIRTAQGHFRALGLKYRNINLLSSKVLFIKILGRYTYLWQWKEEMASVLKENIHFSFLPCKSGHSIFWVRKRLSKMKGRSQGSYPSGQIRIKMLPCSHIPANLMPGSRTGLCSMLFLGRLNAFGHAMGGGGKWSLGTPSWLPL